MPGSTIRDLPGGEDLFNWFGQVPRFHDAYLLDMAFSGKGAGLLRIHTWNLTAELDARGYYVLDRHTVVTMFMEGVTAINLIDVDMMPAIIHDLAVTKFDQQFLVEWSPSYGLCGSIAARQINLALEHGKPAAI